MPSWRSPTFLRRITSNTGCLPTGPSTTTAFAASAPVDARAIVLGLVLSAVTGFACIHYFLKWLTRFGMLPYVIYRLVLGAVLLIVLTR